MHGQHHIKHYGYFCLCLQFRIPPSLFFFSLTNNSVNNFLKTFLFLMQLAVIGKDGWITLLRYSSQPSLYI